MEVERHACAFLATILLVLVDRSFWLRILFVEIGIRGRGVNEKGFGIAAAGVAGEGEGGAQEWDGGLDTVGGIFVGGELVDEG